VSEAEGAAAPTLPDPYLGERSDAAPDDPAEALAAMDEEIESATSTLEVGSPILPCQRPWLELVLFDEEQRPVEGAPYTLSLPDGTRRQGTLGPGGRLYEEDVDADAEKLMVVVEVEENEDGTVKAFHVQVVPREEEPEEEVSEGEPPEEHLRADFPAPWIPG
jgi:hypothetical protein